jgi:opacity protein-like surface antigen
MFQRARTLLILAALLAAPLPALAQESTPVPGGAATASAPAAEAKRLPLGIFAVEGNLSTIFQSGQSSFSGTGVRLHMQPAGLLEGFSLVPSFEYWRNTNKLDTFGIKATESDATLGLEFRYDFPRDGSFKPYVGLGYGLHFQSSEFSASTLGVDGSDSVTRGGVSVLGGVRMPITSHLVNVFDLKFHYLPDDSQTKLNYGLAWQF